MESDVPIIHCYAKKTEAMLDQLSSDFPGFVSKLDGDTDPEQILPGASDEDIAKEEGLLGIPLPESYKRFLKLTRGFDLFGGSVQFGAQHPFPHDFPKIGELSDAQLKVVKMKGGGWPPPSQGMLCFAEYFRDADGDQVLFDVAGGLVDGEYPVVYYSHETHPPTTTQIAASFAEWLNERCIDQMA